MALNINNEFVHYKVIEDNNVLLIEGDKQRLSKKISMVLEVCDLYVKGLGGIEAFLDSSGNVTIMPKRDSFIEGILPSNYNKSLIFISSDNHLGGFEYNGVTYTVLYKHAYRPEELELLKKSNKQK